MTDHLVVLITVGSREEAETIAYTLLEERLAASANILPGCRSIYRWRGEIHRAQETFMIVKTRQEALARLTQRVLELHPYDEPAVIALPILSGSASYLDWITEQVQVDSGDS